jgi:hypothetical protein
MESSNIPLLLSKQVWTFPDHDDPQSHEMLFTSERLRDFNCVAGFLYGATLISTPATTVNAD